MAKGPQGQGQGQNADNSLAPLWAMVGVIGGTWAAWYFGHTYIVIVIFALKQLEISLLTSFYSFPQLISLKKYIASIPPNLVDWQHFTGILTIVGEYIRYPFGILLVGMGAWIFIKSIPMRFRKTYSMNTLSVQEQKNWPQIMPVIGKNLSSEDVRLGPWAMALTPMEFARKYDLLKKDEFAPRASNIEVPLTATIKKGEARRIFTLQLGAYWNGFDVLPPPAKALAAVFIAKINRDRDGAASLLKTFSQTASHGKLDIHKVASIINQFKNTELVQEVVSKHAYVSTVMASLLEKARDDGVLASADFLWLKPMDRRLWYVLNNVGRQTAFVEVGGVFAHWMVEKKLERKSLIPMVEEAVKALEIGIKEVKLSRKEWSALQ